ncbi:MAG: hypothetical protein ACLU85_02560 [Lachnospirales bacterium]
MEKIEAAEYGKFSWSRFFAVEKYLEKLLPVSRCMEKDTHICRKRFIYFIINVQAT